MYFEQYTKHLFAFSILVTEEAILLFAYFLSCIFYCYFLRNLMKNSGNVCSWWRFLQILSLRFYDV